MSIDNTVYEYIVYNVSCIVQYESVCAGPTTADQLVMLGLCIDALKATAAISERRMQTLDSAMHTLTTLLHLKSAVNRVSPA